MKKALYFKSEDEWQFTSVYLDKNGIRLNSYQKDVLKTMLENKNAKRRSESNE